MWLVAVLAAVAVSPGLAGAAGSITGTITFDGKPPALKPLSMDADPTCAKKHSAPVPNEMLALGTGNTMGSVLVWVSKGVPAGKTFPVPKTPMVLDQNGCVYKPHVMGLMVGQTYRIRNSDGGCTNPHAAKITRLQQGDAPTSGATTVFNKPEEVFHVKCDVTPG